MTEVLLASNNPHKLQELEFICGRMQGALSRTFRLVSPRDFPAVQIPEVVEDGSTYRENALKKAIAFSQAFDRAVLADDSGIEVDALAGAPGLLSARFGGAIATEARNALLLATVAEFAPPWTARFRCVLCYVNPGRGTTDFFEAVCEGELRKSSSSENGFGYDPIFFSLDLEKNFSLATAEEKARVSHRGRAVQKWFAFMENRV